MPKTKSKLVPDIRAKNMRTVTETNGSNQTTYKTIDIHAIINNVLNKAIFFSTHVESVWYNKLGGKTLKAKLDEMDAKINTNTTGIENCEKNYLNSYKTVYVSASGSDTTGDGSAQKPWRELSYAVNQCPFSNGVTYNIIVESGSYKGGINISSKKIRIQLNGDIIIDGNNENTISLLNMDKGLLRIVSNNNRTITFTNNNSLRVISLIYNSLLITDSQIELAFDNISINDTNTADIIHLNYSDMIIQGSLWFKPTCNTVNCIGAYFTSRIVLVSPEDHRSIFDAICTSTGISMYGCVELFVRYTNFTSNIPRALSCSFNCTCYLQENCNIESQTPYLVNDSSIIMPYQHSNIADKYATANSYTKGEYLISSSNTLIKMTGNKAAGASNSGLYEQTTVGKELKVLNSLALKYIIVNFPTETTIGDNGYSSAQPFTLNSGTVMFASVHNWGSNTGAFTVESAGVQKNVFAVGTPGIVIRGLQAKVWYVE